MIRHAAYFRLKHPAGSPAEAAFLDAIGRLKSIPGVQRFEVARQVGKKSEFTFGVAMEFADQAAYDGYDVHPDHVRFVKERWVPEVAAFTEIDTVAL